MDRNEKVVFRYLDHADLAADVVKVYATLARARARVAYQQHCPIGELLGADGELSRADCCRQHHRRNHLRILVDRGARGMAALPAPHVAVESAATVPREPRLRLPECESADCLLTAHHRT